MKKISFNRLMKITISLIVFSVFLFSISSFEIGTLKAQAPNTKAVSSTADCKPLIIYYSRSGRTRVVAKAIENQLSCAIEEIKSKRDRTGFGVVNCVLDSLFNREDLSEPFTRDLKPYSPIIVATPIWIGKLSSPVRTFIKKGNLKDKNIYLIITYNGRLKEDKEDLIKKEVAESGIKLKGFYKIITKEKTQEDIKKEARSILEKIPVSKEAGEKSKISWRCS